MLNPLHCKLCGVHLNSVNSSRTHYESKNHNKKIKNWLEEWGKGSGESNPKSLRLCDKTDRNLSSLRCEICEISLSSYQHASQHYAGRKHRQKESAAIFKSTPKEVGVYETKDFLSRIPQKLKGVNFCQICNLTLTSSQQLKFHLNGVKHSKKSKLLSKSGGSGGVLEKDSGIVDATSGIASGAIFQNQKPARDSSTYLTPSGSYYCSTCNVSIANETLFFQHTSSKKHLKIGKLNQTV